MIPTKLSLTILRRDPWSAYISRSAPERLNCKFSSLQSADSKRYVGKLVPQSLLSPVTEGLSLVRIRGLWSVWCW